MCYRKSIACLRILFIKFFSLKFINFLCENNSADYFVVSYRYGDSDVGVILCFFAACGCLNEKTFYFSPKTKQFIYIFCKLFVFSVVFLDGCLIVGFFVFRRI